MGRLPGMLNAPSDKACMALGYCSVAALCRAACNSCISQAQHGACIVDHSLARPCHHWPGIIAISCEYQACKCTAQSCCTTSSFCCNIAEVFCARH